MTFDEMRAALDTLTGLKFRPADYKTHWAGLSDMPIEALQRAVQRAAKQCSEFPSPAELRALADAGGSGVAVYEDRSVPLEVPQVIAAPMVGKTFAFTREWKYYCTDCNDEGWQSMWCGTATAPTWRPWMTPMACGGAYYQGYHPEAHEWIRRCACQATNPAVQHRREREAKYAAQRTDRKSA